MTETEDGAAGKVAEVRVRKGEDIGGLEGD